MVKDSQHGKDSHVVLVHLVHFAHKSQNILTSQLPKVSMRIKSSTILAAGVVIMLGIVTFVGGLRYIVDYNPTRDSTDGNALGGSILICLGFAGFIYGIVAIRDDLLHGKPAEETEVDDERKL